MRHERAGHLSALRALGVSTNGDAYGAPADVPWTFVYMNPAAMVPPELLGVPLHPYPLDELIFDLALFAALWRARGRRPFTEKPGLLIAA